MKIHCTGLWPGVCVWAKPEQNHDAKSSQSANFFVKEETLRVLRNNSVPKCFENDKHIIVCGTPVQSRIPETVCIKGSFNSKFHWKNN